MTHANKFTLVLTFMAAIVLGEDFSVHLERLADIDKTRTLPTFTLQRKLKSQSGSKEWPEKRFDVHVNFLEFGDQVLAEAVIMGPYQGDLWPTGRVSESGLMDLKSVKSGWIKESQDLFVMAWESEVGLGNNPTPFHGYVIIRLKDGRVVPLINRQERCGHRLTNGLMLSDAGSSYFSFNAKNGTLRERICRRYQTCHESPQPLTRIWTDEGGDTHYVASIDETVDIEYKITNDGLVPLNATLTFCGAKGDCLNDIAKYYLGAFATFDALFKNDPSLAQKFKNVETTYHTSLTVQTKIRIPIPKEWLIDRFNHAIQKTRQ